MSSMAALLLTASVSSGPAPIGAPEIPIWPIPREAQLIEDRLLLTEAVIVVPEGDRRAQLPGRLLAELI
ncbi:MAG TPA: hypothetical protein VKA01_04270, partial [Vicinamibacteria bacterium]|nr:hypothetical protein [Vicinamibacteria bacterium]